ncbi:nitrate reductase cytochrome c-type subunit [Curvivirga sp.]|uniref:nitrate reductase cytochrome c-type subunit n=1 Tax=Curvivirga sp. TaxID=2856848 RepID=UPI003B5CC74C
MRKFILAALSVLFISSVAYAEEIATLRGGTPLDEEPQAPLMLKEENADIKRVRNYPEQPPTIPHKIAGYQVDLNANKCMSCHSRRATETSQAPMISITHFMNRDNQFLASVSPRRYFCTQCHVSQNEAKPLVENTFVDVDDVIASEE